MLAEIANGSGPACLTQRRKEAKREQGFGVLVPLRPDVRKRDWLSGSDCARAVLRKWRQVVLKV